MIKRYCDLCGNEAKELSSFEVTEEFGEEYERTQLGTTNLKKTRTKVKAVIRFNIEDHRTGYGGPPDLCCGCSSKLAQRIVEEIVRRGGVA